MGQGRALVHPSLLQRLGASVGDRMKIGNADFVISGVIRQEPDRSVGVFSLGPRVMIGAEDLAATGLVRPGSRVRHRVLFRLPPGVSAEAFKDALAARLPDANVRVTTYSQAQPGVRRFWNQLTVYLGLTGLVALMVGGIGVATSVRAFVRGKLDTIAVLKCLGVGWRQMLAAYLLQTVLLGLGGSLLGAGLGTAVQLAVVPAISPLLPFSLEPSVSLPSVLAGLAMGTGLTLLFALWPLLDIRRVPPALILRRDVEARLPGRRPWLAGVPIAAGLAALVFWQAGSFKVGGLFLGGLAGALALLGLTAQAVIAGARRLPRLRSLAWRHAVANVHRPGSHAGVVLLSLGVAVMLIVAVALLEQSLRAELADRGPERSPAFFFIDIQRDQVEPFARLVKDLSRQAPELTPVVRSRLATINGASVADDPRQKNEEVWYLSREYVLTWGAEPPPRNDVIAGRWWTADEARREPLISVEEDIAKNLGVTIGGTLGFDIQGVTVQARIVNIRKVDWQSFNTNFFVIFSQGALDGAPSTWIATARVPPAEEAAVQSAVTAAFPNVTAIPIREVLERISAVLDQIALAIRLLAGVSIATGLIVTAGALGVSRHQRLYQSVILKTLGATRGLSSAPSGSWARSPSTCFGANDQRHAARPADGQAARPLPRIFRAKPQAMAGVGPRGGQRTRRPGRARGRAGPRSRRAGRARPYPLSQGPGPRLPGRGHRRRGQAAPAAHDGDRARAGAHGLPPDVGLPRRTAAAGTSVHRPQARPRDLGASRLRQVAGSQAPAPGAVRGAQRRADLRRAREGSRARG